VVYGYNRHDVAFRSIANRCSILSRKVKQMSNDRRDRINFTKRTLEALPVPQQKRAVWHDVQTRGLGILVHTTGRKSFFWFRKVNGDPTWKTIGEFPALSIEQARASASDFNTKLATWKSNQFDGPSPFKRQDALTLGTLFERYYETLKTKGCSAKRGPATDKSLKDVKSWYDRYLHRWDDRKVDSIRLERVRDLHKDITEKHGPIIANRAVGLLRRCINWGIHKDLWHGDNPAEKIDWNMEQSRERFVQPDEMARLLKAVEKERGANWDLHDFVLLSLYCGQRKSNLLAMRWEQITQNVPGDAAWEIPVTKNGKCHKVPLLPEALMVLQDRKRRAKTKAASPWVFPSHGKTGHIKDVKKSWKRLRESVNIPDVHIHDLRRTLGSFMAGANVSLQIIGKALGHKSMAATQVYARLQLDPVRQAMTLAIEGMKNSQEQKALGAAND
jgi:integrase